MEQELLERYVSQLQDKDAKAGCAAMQELLAVSAESKAVYPYMAVFWTMLEAENSYWRNRALALIAANAKWDNEGQIEERLEDYLKHINDVKPITVRECLKYLPVLAEAKPALRGEIVLALKSAEVHKYKDSMRPLIQKDIAKVLELLQDNEQSEGKRCR